MPTLDVPASSDTPVPAPAAQAPAADGALGGNPPLVPPGASDAQAPHDGDHNQGGARPAGLEYQRELGTEQDA